MQLSVVYGREIDGSTTTFGTTGYTHKNTFLLYDRKTESVWYPLKPGQMNAVSGKLAGKALPLLGDPKRMRLSEWRALHPASLVLVPPPRRERSFEANEALASRIGPKLACVILSGTKAGRLKQAILSQDKASFSRIPGVGPKTAERLILELKDKFADEKAGEALTGGEKDAADAVAALVNLGYKNVDAQRAVSEAARPGGVELAELIRKSLKILST